MVFSLKPLDNHHSCKPKICRKPDNASIVSTQEKTISRFTLGLESC